MDSGMTRDLAEKLKSSPVKIRAAAMYGSFARDTQGADSDMDLLLISDEINPRRNKRGREIALIKAHLSIGPPLDILLLTSNECISNFENHNPLFLDIAIEGIVFLDNNAFLSGLINETRIYIRDKELRKLDDGWAFPVPYRTEVTLSSISNKDFAMAMFTDGERDFNIGVSIMGSGYYDKAVYHFQQSVEKSVKAVLICFGIFKKTHFVGEILAGELEQRSLEESWKEKLRHLAALSSEIEPEVTWSRYPGIDHNALWIPYEEYSKDDAMIVKNKSEQAGSLAGGFLTWWFEPKSA